MVIVTTVMVTLMMALLMVVTVIVTVVGLMFDGSYKFHFLLVTRARNPLYIISRSTGMLAGNCTSHHRPSRVVTLIVSVSNSICGRSGGAVKVIIT